MSFLENGGFGGLSMLYPVLIIGSAFFALCGSAFFAAWVYQDCRRRGDDPILWALVVFYCHAVYRPAALFSAPFGDKRDLPGLWT